MAVTDPGAAVGRSPAWQRAPDRLRRAAGLIDGLREEGLYLAPIRHHSPACAAAVRALIDEIRPAAVLIEGPEEYAALLPALRDPATRPPVAVLSLDTAGESAGVYPLADFSPEWVAIRDGGEVGAEVAFIDAPWGDRPPSGDDGRSRTLQAERYLAHSRAIAALAHRLGCRDHDEVWDHLFETRPADRLADWRSVFDDVFVWSGLARLDYEDEVLDAEGSLAREARMSARIEERLREGGPVVAVTGAFHTLAIAEALAGAAEGGVVRARRPATGYGPPATDAAWLIRYDHDRLDGLRGYGAGMPAPGFSQRVWDERAAGGSGDVATALLVDVAARANDAGLRISLPETMAALAQARRLAALRERPIPGRTDVLDALTSSFVKTDGFPSQLADAVAAVFGGSRLGEVPPGTAAPPLVAEARARAESLRLVVTDSARRTVQLDARRKESHRARRRFFALMEFIGSGFSRQTGGYDPSLGRRSGRLLEEWEYAWTPMVEANLVERSTLGATIEGVALALLSEREAAVVDSRASDGVARLLAEAGAMGLGDHVRQLGEVARTVLDEDPSLASVIGAAGRVLDVWAARDELDLTEQGEMLLALVDHALAAAGYLLPDAGRVAELDEAETIETLVALRDLVRGRAAAGGERAAAVRERAVADPTAPVRRELARLRADHETAPGVLGALDAFSLVDDEIGEEAFVSRLRARLRPGADPGPAVRYLQGEMRAAPDLVLHLPEMFDAVHGSLRELDEQDFLALLPGLRRAFTWLKPAETARLAEQVAARTGARAGDIDRIVATTEDDLRLGVRVERDLVATLVRDGLAAWAGGGAGANSLVATAPDARGGAGPPSDARGDSGSAPGARGDPGTASASRGGVR